jgi:DNA-binding MarR family transcriptional regulator
MVQVNTTQGINSRTRSDLVLIALRKIVQAIELNSRSLVKRVGLTGPQLVILQEFWKAETLSVGEIARNVSLSQATVTGILDRMEKRDLLVRQRSHQDRRRVLVLITESGKQLLEKAPPLMQEAFVDRFNRLEDWEQSMILSTMQRLVSMMDNQELHGSGVFDPGCGETEKYSPV